MPSHAIAPLARAIADILERGLAQDEAALHCIRSTHGELSPAAIAALAADEDDPQAAPLLELLLFPGRQTALELEEAMTQAALEPADLPALAEALAGLGPRPAALLPDGQVVALPVLEADQAARLVARLAPHRTLPAAARQAVEAACPGLGRRLAADARQIGPTWSRGALAFFANCLKRLPAVRPDPEKAGAVARFLCRFLADLPGDALPLPALMARQSRLLAQLRRARLQEEALAKSNYETLIMAGNRLPYLHAPDIAEELALAEAAILAVTGRPAPETGPSCQDLGAFAEMEELFAALDDQAAGEPEGSR
jgi:hypothetical protein